MTLSGSKVELTHDLGAEISNVVVGQIRSMERHPDSDHMWVCQLDVGQEERCRLSPGLEHPRRGTWSPWPCTSPPCPEVRRSKRASCGGCCPTVCCAPEGAEPGRAGLPLCRHHRRRPAERLPTPWTRRSPPSRGHPARGQGVSAGGVRPGGGGVTAAGDGRFTCKLSYAEQDGPSGAIVATCCSNLHEGDLAAYNTKTNTICTLADLRGGAGGVPPLHPRRHLRPSGGGRKARRRYQAGHRRRRPCGGV